MDDKHSMDKSLYSKDRYKARQTGRPDERGADEVPAVEQPVDDRAFQPQTGRAATNAYSRDNAERYRSMQRHESGGGQGVLEGAGQAVASLGGVAGRLKGKRPVVYVVVALVVLFAVALIAWFAVVSMNMRPSEDVSKSVKGSGFGQPYYVLLLGSDSRSEKTDTARADSIMLCRVDEGAKQVTFISMPRDLRVDIAGHGAGKLNSALTYGGFSGAIDAVSKVADVPISYYAVIYFSGFKKLVDDLGGVTVEVPEGTEYKGVKVPAGKKSHINGKQALVLARCRHGNPPDQGAYAAGDFQRTKNQRNLMKAILKEVLSKNPLEVPGLVVSVSECVETNVPAHKMAFLAMAMKGMDTDKMYSASVPCTSSYINGVSYQILDQAAWNAMMARVKEGKDPN